MSSSTNAWTGGDPVADFSVPRTSPRARSEINPSRKSQLAVGFQPIQSASGKQPIGYRAVTAFCDSHARAIPFSELMGWAKSRELQGILQSYRLQEVLEQAGPRLNGSRLVLPLEAELFYANQWSWLEVAERAENVQLLTGQLMWELLASEAEAAPLTMRRFMLEGREFFARFVLTVGATRTPNWTLIEQLRPDFVQFPEQLIAGCAGSQYRRESLVEALARAHGLGLKTLACGVHARVDWEWLCSQGIAGGTGSWLGGPGPLPEVRRPLV
ncbi:MAG: EAL domain-containing protein [Planctomycetota bacterium]